MYKKILSIALSVMVILSAINVPFVAMAEEDTAVVDEIKTVLDNNAEEAILKYLSIKKEDSGALNQEITRGEFADMLVPLIIYTNESGEIAPFVDVPAGHKYYSSINRVVGAGVMNGVSETEMHPDEPIIYEHARIAVIRALCFGRYKNIMPVFDNNFEKFATEIGLKYRSSAGKNVTREMAYDLLYDAIFTEVLEPVYTSGGVSYKSTDITVLEEQFNIVSVSGVLVDNGITGLNRKTAVNEDQIKIEDAVLKCEDESIRDYLGYDLQCYVKREDDKNVLVSYSLLSGTDVVEISGRDLISATDDVVKYGDGSKEKEIKISGINIIYNGKYDPTFIPEMDFAEFDGTVTFIRNSGDSAYSTAYVRKRECFVVNSTNSYNTTVSCDDGTKLELDSDTSDAIIEYFYKGETADFSKISPDNILSVEKSRDGELLKIYISDNIVTGYVNTIKDDGVYVDDVFYEYSKYLEDKVASGECIAPVLGKVNYIYLDYDGRMALVDKTALRDTYGWLEAIGADDDNPFDKEYKAKIFSEKGQMLTYTFGDKVTVDGVSKKTEDYVNSLDLKDDDGVLKRMIMFKATTKNVIKSITTPQDHRLTSYAGGDEDVFSLDRKVRESAMRKGAHSTFDRAQDCRIDASTIVMQIPTERGSDVSNYGVTDSSTFSDNTEYSDLWFFDLKNNKVVTLVVQFAEAGAAAVENGSPLMVLKELGTELNEDGETTLVAYGYDNTGEFSVALKDEDVCDETGYYWPYETVNDVKVPVGGTNHFAGVKIKDLPQGSVFQFGTNAKGEIDGIRILHLNTPTNQDPYDTWSLKVADKKIKEGRGERFNAGYYEYVTVSEMHPGIVLYKMLTTLRDADDSGSRKDENNQNVTAMVDFPVAMAATKKVIIYDASSRRNPIRMGTGDEIEAGDKLFMKFSNSSLGVVVVYKQ